MQSLKLLRRSTRFGSARARHVVLPKPSAEPGCDRFVHNDAERERWGSSCARSVWRYTDRGDFFNGRVVGSSCDVRRRFEEACKSRVADCPRVHCSTAGGIGSVATVHAADGAGDIGFIWPSSWATGWRINGGGSLSRDTSAVESRTGKLGRPYSSAAITPGTGEAMTWQSKSKTDCAISPAPYNGTRDKAIRWHHCITNGTPSSSSSSFSLSSSSSSSSSRLYSSSVTRSLASEILAGAGAEVGVNGDVGQSKAATATWSWSMLVLILPCVATFGLGTWQLQRRQWKLNLLERMREKLHEKAMPLRDVLSSSSVQCNQHGSDGRVKEGEFDWEALEYRKVTCSGYLDNSRSVFIGPRVKSAMGVPEKGYYLITPLIMRESEERKGEGEREREKIEGRGKNPVVPVAVLVNRGWVPATWRDRQESHRHSTGQSTSPSASPSSSSSSSVSSFSPRSPSSPPSPLHTISVDERRSAELLGGRGGGGGGRVDEIADITGVLRLSERPSSFVPANSPEGGQWFFIDVPAIARACGLPESTPLIELVSDDSEAKSVTEDNGQSDDVDFPIRRALDEVAKSTVMPQDHANYALTWYTLSAATSYMAWRMLRRPPRRHLRGRMGAGRSTSNSK